MTQGQWLAASLALAVALARAAAGEAPACLASAVLEPPVASVGQQVLYRLRILSREDVTSVGWVAPPAFPDMRAELLPGRPFLEPVERDGARYRVREEQRALFPERAGELPVPSHGVSCQVVAEGRAAEYRAAVPELRLRALDPPQAGRPPDFAGLVGPVALRWTVRPQVIALGESVRATLELRGSGNLWVAPDPFPRDDAFADADVFRLRPEQRLEAGARLEVQRRFAYDVVPRAPGPLRIPAVRIPYLDPQTRGYAFAEAPSLTVAVAPRAAPDAPRDDAQTGERAGAQVRRPAAAGALRRALAAVLAVGAAVFAAVWHRRRRARAAIRAALSEARRAGAAGDADAEAAALARALRLALARGISGARDAPTEALLARARRPADGAAARLLAAVERARFDPNAPRPDRAAVEAALEAR